MKPVYTLLFIISSFSASAQFNVEMGFSLGRTFPAITEQVAPRTELSGGGSFVFNTDLNFNPYETHGYFTLGVRLGGFRIPSEEYYSNPVLANHAGDFRVTVGYFGAAPGAHCILPLGNNLAFRMGINALPAIEIVNFFHQVKLDIGGEAYIGIMTGEIFSFGIKCYKPLNSFQSFYNGGSYFKQTGNKYQTTNLMLDVKLRFVRPKHHKHK